MVTCSCPCGGEVSAKTAQRHLKGKGPLRVIIAQQQAKTVRREEAKQKKKTRRQNMSRSSARSAQLPAPHTSTPSSDEAANAASTSTTSHSTSFPMDIDDPPASSPIHNSPLRSNTPDMNADPTNSNTASMSSSRGRRVVVEEVFEDDNPDLDESDLDDLGGPSDSEDEDYINAMEPKSTAPAGSARARQGSSFKDNLPEHLRGLSIAEILNSEWYAAAFARERMRLRRDEERMRSLRAFNYKVDTNQTGRAYDRMRRAFPELSSLRSTFRLQKDMAALAGFEPRRYNCCVNSCCLFVGDYENELLCPYCQEAQYNRKGRPRRTFSYIPLIPRLVALFLDPDIVRKMRYRAERPSGEGPSEDIFDGSHYLHLIKTLVTVGGEELTHKFFSLVNDIAMGISTDGFCPFKRRKQTCWPIIGFLYNLPPEIRFRLENILCFGVIPGPHAPKDMSSFLIPLIEEFEQLARGVSAYDALEEQTFALHAYLIVAFGDMPAVAKLMNMKGHNGLSPCRACRIIGVQDPRPRVTTHYTPLHRNEGPSYDPLNLPLRTHDEMMDQACQVTMAPDDEEAKCRSKRFGINGVSSLATLSSMSFPDCFPHDFMHLAIENVLKELVTLWTCDYKGLDDGEESYRLSSVWDAIGQACSEAGNTIPSSFGCRVPNIAKERHHFIAESWLLFGTVLGPALLRGRFARPEYYDHFIKYVTLLTKCMQLSLTDNDIDDIEVGFAEWVQEFERIYYQYNDTRLPVCTLPLHALLHIANDIRRMGPVWCYWAFPTERFCGSLLPAVKSRKHPYACLDHRVRDLAQLLQIKTIFGLTDDLDLSDRKAVMSSGVLQPGYDDVLLVPPRTSSALSVSLRKKVATYLRTNYELGTMKQAEHHVSRTTSVEYGKMYLPAKAAIIHASELLQSAETSDRRDASFVQFKRVVRTDSNRSSRLIKKTSYGQVLRLIALTLAPPFPVPDGGDTLHLVLALVQPVSLVGQNTFGQPHYRTTSASIIVDVTAITDVVGRVRDSSGDWVLTLRTGAVSKHDVPEPAT